MPGALFDVGFALMDETPRLEAALLWLEARTALGSEALRGAYSAACAAPRAEHPSLIVQSLVELGLARRRAEDLRRELPWDAVPLVAYPDALEALDLLKQRGLRVGVLANQPASALGDLRCAGIAALCDGIWLSEAEGLAKPDPRFFRLALDAWGLAPGELAYVGDRPDNDVAPARALGMLTVRVLSGPHRAQQPRSAAERPDIETASLRDAALEIAAALA